MRMDGMELVQKFYETEGPRKTKENVGREREKFNQDDREKMGTKKKSVQAEKKLETVSKKIFLPKESSVACMKVQTSMIST